MPRITRRKLLVGAGVAAAVPTGWLGIHAASSRSSIIAGYLREQLPGLAVSDTNVEQFANEYLERHVTGAGRKVYHEAIFLLLGSPMLAAATPQAVRLAFDKFSRNLLTSFLKSTDFFGAADLRLENTTYLGFFDPYKSACGNTLANFAQGA